MDLIPPAAGTAGLPAAAAAPTLHPALWRASQVGSPHAAAYASGFAALDAALPGGGWPTGALTELLLPHPGVGELRLLAPLLAALQHRQRSLMWFDPPGQPCAWALQALGLEVRQLVLVRPRAALPPQPRARAPAAGGAPSVAAADTLWALEHALRSGHLGAVLAWLPARLPLEALRRLQLAAQGHAGPAFLLRPDAALALASPAPLRLALASAGPDLLRVTLVKRRGPPLAQSLLLELAPVLAVPARARAQRTGMAGTIGPAFAGLELALRPPSGISTAGQA